LPQFAIRYGAPRSKAGVFESAFQNSGEDFCDHAIGPEFAEEGLAEFPQRPIIKGPGA
jgi:hypothetical protein